MLRLPIMILSLTALVPGAPVAEAADGDCYPDWSVAAGIVEAEKLVTVDKLISGAKTSIPGDIVKTTLCEEGGKYVFRLVVRNKGSLKTVTVDAHEPFPK